MTTKIIVDCSTGVVEEVELTEEELAQREADRIAFEAAEAARLAQEAEKSESKCMTWSISYEYMPSEEDRGGVSPISSSTVEYVHHYTAGDTESTVGLTLIAHTPT